MRKILTLVIGFVLFASACGSDGAERPATKTATPAIAFSSTTSSSAEPEDLPPRTVTTIPAPGGYWGVGTWIGEWSSETTEKSGRITLVIADRGRWEDKSLVTIELSGSVFGVDQIDPFAVSVYLFNSSYWREAQIVETDLLGMVTLSGDGCGSDNNFTIEATEVPGDLISGVRVEGRLIDSQTIVANYETRSESDRNPEVGKIVLVPVGTELSESMFLTPQYEGSVPCS